MQAPQRLATVRTADPTCGMQAPQRLLTVRIADPTGEMQEAKKSGYKITVATAHPWRPPFDLDRVGHPLTAVIESTEQPAYADYVLTVLLRGKEVGRHPFSFSGKPPCSATLAFSEYGNEVVLSAAKPDRSGRIDLVRQPLKIASFDFDAVARPEMVINPVDLGTILVPHGWLLLGPVQKGTIEIALICRERDEAGARIRAFYPSAPDCATTASVNLRKGQKQRLTLALPEPPKTLDRDVLQVLLVDGKGNELARKSIPVMLVRNPPKWPRFGAAYTKLRYDAPISVRDPKTGALSSLKYEDGWDPSLQDVVVSLPNGARFVFWRGSSYIPFWAGKHNTGACYEWAEMISRVPGAADCVEPLMDKELRYGRVETIASTPARVHVRWRYQSTDLHYQVWGDEAVEDYYFYPDGFGTRVLNLKADPTHDYELSEFIILTPQGTYPFNVLPENLVDATGLDGRKWGFRFPSPSGELDRLRQAMTPPSIYRLRLNKDEPMSAIYFNPLDRQFPEVIFGAFTDRGQVVTPCYWGSHWPLARGNATGYKIDDRIALTPCHNSVMSWARVKPEPVRAAQRAELDSQGRSRPLSIRRWVWLIGMSAASDIELGKWAESFAFPPSMEVQGGKLDFNTYAPERRALRLSVQDKTVTIKLKPLPDVMNPVFELAGAPDGPLTVHLDGNNLSPAKYAWDGRTLWLNATIEKPTEIRLGFSGMSRRLDAAQDRP
ncbi:MAG: hypothetical protein ACP5XB_14295 [Isosphaeraceae bacterium]